MLAPPDSSSWTLQVDYGGLEKLGPLLDRPTPTTADAGHGVEHGLPLREPGIQSAPGGSVARRAAQQGGRGGFKLSNEVFALQDRPSKVVRVGLRNGKPSLDQFFKG